MALGLREDVRFCLIGSRTIFIDIAAERYFGLPASLDEAFRRLLDPTPLSSAEQKTLQSLVDRGLLIEDGKPPIPTPPLCKPDLASDLMTCLPEKISSSAIALALWSETVAATAYHRLSLRRITEVLCRWRQRRPGQTHHTENDLQSYYELTGSFRKTAFLFPPADRCLTKALAYLSACGSRHLNPSLVFGVRANPFAAHCWVQHESFILNDELERVRIFTPILVL